jgi:alginate O-acetyltransferase complex protein AlgI
MLFHSPEFLFLFLPLTLAGYFVIGKLAWKTAFAWLALASLFFYGWWRPIYVALLLASILFNYGGGLVVARMADTGWFGRARILLALLVAANLELLIRFKYLAFFAGQIDGLFDTRWQAGEIILPIGISFYTFTQIAYLVDTFLGRAREKDFIGYVLFVTYFPHLVAGPVLHHAEMMPQFANPGNLRFDAMNFSRGITFLAFGLFKKIVLADGCAPIANEAFHAVSSGLSPADAWLGALAYTLQIYFDFSGYSDMAIGLSLMFNIRLPVNFDSPYRATSIIDFWRRWHMTLSRFLRDYLYIPLGGNRKGMVRHHANLMAVMLLGGLWHGANWTFVIWGGLHGLYLVVNHLWRGFDKPRPRGGLTKSLHWLLTFLAVTIAWVFFRAASLTEASSFLAALFGQTAPLSVPVVYSPDRLGFILASLLLAVFAPNTNQILDYRFGGGRNRLRFPPGWPGGPVSATRCW